MNQVRSTISTHAQSAALRHSFVPFCQSVLLDPGLLVVLSTATLDAEWPSHALLPGLAGRRARAPLNKQNKSEEGGADGSLLRRNTP